MIKINSGVCLIIFILLLMTGTAAAQPSDISGHWAEQPIQDWIGQGLAGGYQDNTFKPDNRITRAEFMALVNRVYGFTSEAPVQFSDVHSTDWYAAEVAKAMAAGYISGYSDGTVRPGNSITREEVAAMLTRICDLTTPDADNVLAGFVDAGDIQWSKTAVASVTAVGYMNGYLDQTFQPAKPITRAEAISTLDRAKAGAGHVAGGAGEQTAAASPTGPTEPVPVHTPAATPAETPDITPPAFVSSYPRTSRVTSTAADLQVKTNEPGRVYYVVLEDGSAMPASGQVKAGLDARDAVVPEHRKGSIAVRAQAVQTITVSGLVTAKSYDLYVVAEDAAPNLQYGPVKVEFSTVMPAFVSAETNTAGTKVLVTFNKDMADPDGKHRQFTVLVNGKTNNVQDLDLMRDARLVNLDLKDAVVYGQTVTVAYAAGSVTAADGSELADFGAKSVKNLVMKPPGAPTGLKASPGEGEVTLNWNTVSDAEHYKIYQSVSTGGPYTQLSSNRRDTEYRVRGLLNGVTYYFVVQACNDGGDSGNSNQVSATPVAEPNIPTGLTASAGNAEVNLHWNAVSGAIGYKLYRANSSGGPYTQIWGGKAASYKAAGLTNGKTYYFVVQAVNNSGDSGNSNQASATPSGPPGPPAGLTATAGSGFATLHWEAAPGATSYKVYSAGSAGGSYSELVKGWIGTSYTITKLTGGRTYYFAVKSSNASGDSVYSNQASATLISVPPTPSGLTAAAGNGQVTLHWNAVDGATGYKVYRTEASGETCIQISQVLAGTSFTVTGLSNGKKYYFMVRAANPGGESGNSKQVSATPAIPGTPSAPTGLTATAGNGLVNLRWNPAAGAASYKVYQSSGGPYTQISAGETGTDYSAVGLTNGVTYYFVVRAHIDGVDSPNSHEVSATPTAPVPPGAPAGLKATAAGSGQVTLHWNPVAGAAGYKVFMAETAGGPYTGLKAGLADTSYTVTGLTNGKTYYFVVQAGNAGGNSPNSNEAAATVVMPPPGAPRQLSATAGSGQVLLNWAQADGAVYYKIYQSSGGPYQEVASEITATSYTVSGLTNGTTYYFVVKAGNAGGDSEYSNQASATPVEI